MKEGAFPLACLLCGRGLFFVVSLSLLKEVVLSSFVPMAIFPQLSVTFLSSNSWREGTPIFLDSSLVLLFSFFLILYFFK